MTVDKSDFNVLLDVAKELCYDYAERAYHGESDLDDQQEDLFQLIKKYDPDYVNPLDERRGIGLNNEEDE